MAAISSTNDLMLELELRIGRLCRRSVAMVFFFKSTLNLRKNTFNFFC